jgi:hypothetical protein
MSRQLQLFRHEPPEPAQLDPVNAALDRIEADVRIVVDAGGEAALKSRLARLLGEDPRRGSRKGGAR